MPVSDIRLFPMYFNTIATQFDQNNLQGFISALTEAVQNGFSVTKDINNTKYGKLNLLEFMLRQIFNRQYCDINSERESYFFLDAVLSNCKNINAPIIVTNSIKRNGLQYIVSYPTQDLTKKIKYIDLFLSHGADVNSFPYKNYRKNPPGLSYVPPLFLAQEPEIIEILLKAGADVHYIAPVGKCALSVIDNYLFKHCPLPFSAHDDKLKTAFNNALRAINLLLQYGASPNAETSRNVYTSTTPLLILSAHKKFMYNLRFCDSPFATDKHQNEYFSCLDNFCIKATDMLLKAGADIGYKDSEGNNVINVCGSSVMLDKFLELGCGITHANKGGYTILNTIAADTKHKYFPEADRIAMADKYLALGGAADVPSFMKNRTALFYAAISCDTVLIKKLAAHGAEINRKDENGDVPVVFALFGSYSIPSVQRLDTLQIFDDLGADFNNINNNKETILHMWARSAVFACEEAIKKRNITEMKELYDTYNKILDLLVNRGVDVNAQSNVGLTPAALLTRTVDSKNISYVVPFLTSLINHNADINIRDITGKTLIDRIPQQKWRSVLRDHVEQRRITEYMVEDGIKEYER